MADKEIVRSNISEGQNEKLAKFFTRTLDKNDDGVVNWSDFEAAIEVKYTFRFKVVVSANV